ncbi:hypothetical protein Agabi119p4_5169 [Agaricus bisporus var. burnettii]|uniref:Uncharacterized protein n=1 Tax=Agaricus bisporus var. burnettii TaxID=192524 RepID=A0A8H7KI03_AGABI|nr:hypothetical protein Agabi119p4_5169 [Agaricus bisporus var. burnettii]
MSTLTTLTGIVVLTGPRPLDSSKGPRNLLVDATIYAHDDHVQNPSSFANPPPTLNPELRTSSFAHNDYCFVGDIAHVTLLPDSTDPCQECFIIASGSVDNVTSTKGRTFMLKCNQYISFLKSSSSCYLTCSFPDTTRWEKTSLPKVNSTLTVAGTLDAINRAEEGSVSSFILTVEAIGYPPRQQLTKTRQHLSSTDASSSATTKTGFHYSHAPQKQKAIDDETEPGPSTKKKTDSKKDKDAAKN